ncbi:MAG TPA: TIGR03435 family protein [Bryobacteraceae bacterium]|jgi:uncharacterized protein (TIGR03435 family)
MLKKLTLTLFVAAITVFGQAKPSFEVATIKPSAPLDPAKIMAAMQAGGKLPVGMDIDAHRAQYRYLDLKTLISLAYGMKPYQVTGPDWMGAARFDIEGTLPAGASKDDVPKMLKSLLEDRFKLTSHLSSAEHPVLALVVGKGGLKMKESTETPKAIDESAPGVPGEVITQGPDGPIRMKMDMTKGTASIDMGLKGKMRYAPNAANGTMQIDFSMVTMGGLADMITQIFTQLGGTSGRQVVDQTGIKGNYEASLNISLADMIAMARNAGMDIPGGQGGPGGAAPAGAAVASDPSTSGATLQEGVQNLGLKLESRKAVIDQLIVDHLEKTPTEN